MSRKKTAVVEIPRSPVVRTSMNYVHGQRDGDRIIQLGLSQTVPDQSLTIPEILARYTRGMPVPQTMPHYSDDDLPNLKALDLTDIDELREHYGMQVSDGEGQLRDYARRRKEAYEKALDARIERQAKAAAKKQSADQLLPD